MNAGLMLLLILAVVELVSDLRKRDHLLILSGCLHLHNYVSL